MSTTQMPFPTVAESFTNAFTGMLDQATDVTRTSTEAYLAGLDAIVEQQKLAHESSWQWVSDLVSVQADLGRQAARSYTSGTDRAAGAAVESTEATQDAVANAVRSTSPRRASAKRGQTAPSRRRPRQAPTPERVGVTVAGLSSERYDSLNASEIIEKLPGLSQRDLRETETYESAHQARQTVLERVGSLRGPEPIVGYDELTVPEVQAHLTSGDQARATSVRDYERAHKQRDGVLQAAQARIDKA